MQHEGSPNWVAEWWVPSHGSQEKGWHKFGSKGSLNYFILSSASLSKMFRICRVVESRENITQINLLISYCKWLENSLLGIKFSPGKLAFLLDLIRNLGNCLFPLHNLCGVAANLGMLLRKFASELAFEAQRKNPSESLSKQIIQERNNILRITEDV